MTSQSIGQAAAADPQLASDFDRICDCGGRRAGTASETVAIDLALRLLRDISPSARAVTVPYAGWRNDAATLTLFPSREALACKALLGSQPTPGAGLEAEIVDLGRGTESDFNAARDRLHGRIALVRHEYPFSPSHIHRRRKYNWAIERGAAGFIIASPYPDGGTVCGSSGRGGTQGIPAVATDYASALRLCSSPQHARVALQVTGEDHAAETRVLILELPGRTHRKVVLSAHLDGHDLAESAMDNASGVAVALALARAFAPHVHDCRLGLTVCLFSAEEWALAGSRSWLERMDEPGRVSIALNVNLDTVGGDDHLTALTSEFIGLERFVADTSAEIGIPVSVYRPMMANSDHYNFARHGIPALRLVAGFDRPDCNVRHILSPGDTRTRVRLDEMRQAARVASALVWRALNADDETLTGLR